MASVPAQGTTQSGVRATLWILLVVYIFNFLDRQIVNILAEPIARDLNLSDTQIGLMTGLAFALFYTVLGLPIARYADRPTTNRPRLISLALAIWSGMTALCGIAQNFWQLLLARIGVGVGEAGCTPAAHSLISDMVPKERRASALAFYALGIPIGSLLGMIIGGFLADTIGWRKAFVVVGLPGVAMAFIVWTFLRDPRGDQTALHAAIAAPPVAKPPLRERVLAFYRTVQAMLAPVFSSKALVLLIIAASSASFLSYGKATWATIFFQRTHGLSAGETGLYFGLVNGIAGIIGTWLGGWIADRWGTTNRRHVLTAPAIGMAVAVPIAYLGYAASDWRMALVFLFIPTILNSLYFGPTYSSAQGLVPLPSRATAAAVLLFFQNLIGLGFGPLIFGKLSDLIKPQYGEASVQIVLYTATVVGLIPAFFFWRCSLRLNDELDQKG